MVIVTSSTAEICTRTTAVHEAIVAQTSGISDCADITDNHLAAIGTLDLSNKRIVSLKSGDFDGLSSLTRLSLYNNQLTTIQTGAFNGLSSLTYLFLYDNQLTTLPVGVFNDLSSLTSLHLENNQLTTLPVDVFNGLSSLTELRLDDNQLTTLPVGVFNGLSSLTWLYLYDNQLTTLPVGVFNGLSSLTYLFLYDNQLTTLPVGVFNGLSSLTSLYLSRNQLTTLPANVFNGLSSLTGLYLGGNQLTTLPANVFNGLSSLTSLYLPSNQLTTLPANVFNGLSSLTSLTLSNNQLTTLPVGVFNGLGSLTNLSLSDNPGTPFTLTLELVRTDSTDLNASAPARVAVKLAEGAPFDMSINLSIEGGGLSATTATIAAGETTSAEIIVTQTSNSPVTVRLGAAPALPATFVGGIEIATGAPLTLFGSDVYMSGVTLGVEDDGTVGWSADPDKYLGARISSPEVSLESATYMVSEIAYNPTASKFRFAFAGDVPDDIAELMVSFNPDLNFKDATRNGNVFTWSNVAASVIKGQRIALTLSRIESSVDASFNLDVDESGDTNIRDIIMIARHVLLGLSGDALITGQSSGSADTVVRNIRVGMDNKALDVDERSGTNIRDIIMIARYVLLGLGGDALVTGQSSAAPDIVERNVGEMLEE